MNRELIEKAFSMNLIKLRKHHKLTQSEMADLLGVKRSRYGSWEETRCFPPIELIIDMSNLFGYEIKRLLTDDLFSDG